MLTGILVDTSDSPSDLLREAFGITPLSTQPLFSSERTTTSSSTPSKTRIYKPFSALSGHLVLHVVYLILPDSSSLGISGKPLTEGERARKTTRTLFWMANNLRLVNRSLYLGMLHFLHLLLNIHTREALAATMHILRSTYLPKYLRHIRKPYSSDPFPSFTQPATGNEYLLSSVQRESHVNGPLRYSASYS